MRLRRLQRLQKPSNQLPVGRKSEASSAALLDPPPVFEIGGCPVPWERPYPPYVSPLFTLPHHPSLLSREYGNGIGDRSVLDALKIFTQ